MGGKLKAAGAKFWSELRRRRVIKTTVAYVIGAWLVVEMSATVFPALLLPEWTVRIVVATAILALPIIIILAWMFDIERRPTSTTDSETNKAGSTRNSNSQQKNLPPTLTSAISSIAVLPFEILSPDENHKFIADGIATELHSTLSLAHRLRVISRTSSFGSANGETDVKNIAAKLGAKFIISGSVRFVDDRMRLIVELDNAAEGVQIWSETYDRKLDDVFSVQQELAGAVTSAFGGARLCDEIAAATIRNTENLDAWSLVQKARSFVLEFTPRALRDAVPLLRRAIELDAEYAVAHAALAFVLAEQILNGLGENIETNRDLALESADRAFMLSPGDPFVLKMCGAAWAYFGEAGKSLRALHHAADIAPFDFGTWGYMGWSLVQSGEQQALGELHEIMGRMLQTAPRHPGVPYWLYHRSVACTCEGHDAPAVDFAQKSVEQNPAFPWGWMQYANALGRTGAVDDAKKAVNRVAEISPALTPGHYELMIRAMSATDEVCDSRLAGLNKLNVLRP